MQRDRSSDLSRSLVLLRKLCISLPASPPPRLPRAGQLVNSPDNLIRWIVDPQTVEPGTAMPNLGVILAVARDMAAYLYTLQ